MPLLHPVVIGAQGDPHSRDWHIADFECGYVAPAKLLAMMAIDLLFDDAAGAQAVLDAHEPAMSKDEYLENQRRVFRTETFDDAG